MTIKISIKMTPDADTLARPFQKNYDSVIDEELGSLARETNENIKAEAPKKSGKLRAGHKVKKRGKMSYEGYVDPRVKHYGPVRFGTGPRIIKPRVKKALYWVGAAHPVRIVHHPGNRPNDWVERGLDRSESDMRRTEEKIGATIEQELVS